MVAGTHHLAENEDDDWDGVWWSESINSPKRREQYNLLVARLASAKPEEIARITSEIFQLGHENGYELRADLEYD